MIDITTVKTFFFDSDSIQVQPYDVYRAKVGKFRVYYRWLGDEPILYSSLTTAIHHSMPMADQLIDYYVKHGRAEAERLTMIAANYGTLMHEQIGEYCRSQYFDFNHIAVSEIVNEYLSRIDFYQPECKEWVRKLQEDMAAWMQFENDYSLTPIAVELILVSDQNGYGTPIDVVAKAKVPVKGFYGETYKSGDKKGQPKQSTELIDSIVLINMKSGRKGIYDTHRVQLEFEKRLFEENYPDIKVDRIYNWAPKDWESNEPTYKLVDQTGKTSDDEFEGVRLLAKTRFVDGLYDKEFIGIFGEHTRGNPITSNIIKNSLVDGLKKARLQRITSNPLWQE